ncbi:S-layer homology domain-containing protein [Paenibacillus glycanilyticus]|nr:S-layer homology domain-containing protein [Paenibacillus glycanilyticus]
MMRDSYRTAAGTALLCAALALGLTGCFGDKNEPGKSTVVNGPQVSDQPVEASPLPSESVNSDTAEGAGEVINVSDISNHPAGSIIGRFLATGAATVEGGNFRPNEPITRGELYEWLVKLDPRNIQQAGEGTGAADSSFTDMDSADPLAAKLSGYAAEGYVKPLDGNRLALEEPLLREQLPSIIATFFHIEEALNSRSLLLPNSYFDRDDITPDFFKPLAYYRAAEVYSTTFGDTSLLRPKEAVTRGEAAEFVMGVLDYNQSLLEGIGLTPDKLEHADVKLEDEPASETVVEPDDFAGHKYEEDIKSLLDKVKLPASEPAFKPDETITRREFIAWMYQYDPNDIKPHHPSTGSFSDMAADDASYDLVEGLRAAGMINGFEDGTIRLDEPLTREQLTKLWADYERNWTVLIENLAFYSDKNKVGKLYRETMTNFLVAGTNQLYKKIFIGDQKELKPQSPVTRAEAAAWIVQGTE